jgi:hypothetical protein
MMPLLVKKLGAKEPKGRNDALAHGKTMSKGTKGVN